MCIRDRYQRRVHGEIQLCVKHVQWDENTSFLYSGGTDAIIHIYDTKTFKERGNMSGWNPFFKNDRQQYGHAGPIADLLPIHMQNNLASASLDGHIGLWDIPTHTFKKELRGHKKGIYSLDWSNEARVLLSAGLDHEAYVWNAYVKEKIFLLRGHNHPLVGVKCLEGTPQAITADISGMVKVWDMRNFLCCQTFNVPVDEINCFALTYPKKRIVVGSKNLLYYDYDEPKDQLLTDEKMCLRVLFNDELRCFVTLHPDCVKIWDARNGKLQSVYRELSNSDLTVCCLDHRQRKLFVGDADGHIFTINVKNGAKMKKFEKHDALITDLCYFLYDDKRLLVSCARERCVKLHDDNTHDMLKSCRYKMEAHKKSVNALAVNRKDTLVASCSDDQTVLITNLLSYRQEGLLKHQDEIKKVVFMSPHPCVATADATGRITIWTVHPSPDKNIEKANFVYKTLPVTSKSNKPEQFPISSMAFDAKTKYLIIGDDFGNVTLFDTSRLIEKIDAQTKLTEKGGIRKNRKEANDLSRTLNNLTRDISGAKISDETELNDDSRMSVKRDKDNTYPLTGVDTAEDIVQVLQFKAHNDGITYIEVLKSYDCFATSSFDCCVYVWSMTGKRIGALILGEDKNWGLYIDEEPRKKEKLEEAEFMLKTVKNKDYKELFREDRRVQAEKDKMKKASRQIMELDQRNSGEERKDDEQFDDPGSLSNHSNTCLLYTSPSPRDGLLSRMPSSA
eukprot:TRINITY_DN3849_c0_g3_i2.p1 TRINITY_DN3849_c0_g3~~TRINITY_DN3849_c0_g3_i2.p1  ORF type:complete len:733 (-),score=175.98 TRINITY_DN3849_c0_g3_i2:58-2256(-)